MPPFTGFEGILWGFCVRSVRTLRVNKMAEGGGFEPPEPQWGSLVFETSPFDRSGTLPAGTACFCCQDGNPHAIVATLDQYALSIPERLVIGQAKPAFVVRMEIRIRL